jgi:hypothetical protein
MWIDANGVIQVELNWDDPWVVFDDDLRSRLESAPKKETAGLEDALWTQLPETIDSVTRAFPAPDAAQEAMFVGLELARKPWLRASEGTLVSLVVSQILDVDPRWRLDVLQTALQALAS